MADHYAVLGLAPYAEHSAVRAAYLELIRRYHPDINTSPEAAARAREVTAAYKVLGNPDSRIDYDLARAQAHAAIAQQQPPRAGSPRAIAALASIGGAGFLAFFLIPSAGEQQKEEVAAVDAASPLRQQADSKVVASPAAVPAERTAVPDAPVSPAPVRTAQPLPAEKLPASPVITEVKPAAAVAEKPRAALAKSAPSRPEPRRAVVETPRTSSNATDLSALDRHLGMVFRQSMRSADPAKQQSLYRDHYRFIARLNACSTAACKEREYLARMAEVSTTMAAKRKAN